MNIVVEIARDTIRMLLRQKLLLAVIIVSSFVTLLFSTSFATMRSKYRESMATMSNKPTLETTSQAHDKAKPDVRKREIQESLELAGMIFQGFFYGVVSLGGTMIALLIFPTVVSSEVRRGTIRITLSKAVSRPQFLLGKWLGALAIMTGYSAVTAMALIFFVQLQHASSSPALIWAPWLMFCKQIMLGTLAMLLSLSIHPTLAAVLAYFSGAELLQWMMGAMPLLKVPYAILPSYGRFNLAAELMTGSLIEPSAVGMLTLYAVDFVALILLLALWRFRKLELV